jgi:prepilin-type N-terminal cleavage/methylation domain-containing protein
MIPKTAHSRGFTLLELLVAMSMMVVVASCLYSTLYTAFNSRRIGLVAIEPDSAALNVIELMKQDFVGAVGPVGHLTGSFVATPLQFGEDNADDVVFYTTSISGSSTASSLATSSAASSLSATNTNGTTSISSNNTNTTPLVGGVAKVEFALVDNERQANYRLVRRVTTNLLSPKDLVPEEQVLCRSVKSLSFRFYDGNDWVDSWDSTSDTDANSLPLAVEITIAISYDDSHANGSASVLSYNDRVNVIKTETAYKTRRLREAFVIPCGGKATIAAATTTTSTSSTGSGGGAGGGSGGGGGAGGGAGTGGS